MGAFRLGAQLKNVASPNDGEQAFTSALNFSIDSVRVETGAAYKLRLGSRADPDKGAVELSASAERKLGAVTLALSLVYSPDDLGGTGRSLFVEGGPSLALGPATIVSASVGRRDRQGSPDYMAFSIGMTRTLIGNVAVDVRYHGTNKSKLGAEYRARPVISVLARF